MTQVALRLEGIRLDNPQRELALFISDSQEVPTPDPEFVEGQAQTLVALSRIRGAGSHSLRALFDRYADLREIWGQSEQDLTAVLNAANVKVTRPIVEQIGKGRAALEKQAQDELVRFAREGITVLTLRDPRYPQQLASIGDPPRWLFVHGDPDVLSRLDLIAVVGTREASSSGIRRTSRLGAWLAERGFGIVSGLAEGIDQAAHQAALDYGVPTIGVLGTGLNVVFPASSAPLRPKIIEQGGAVITEYLPQESYSRQNFVQRNRIQAGLSYATVPVEAKVQSGTAHTFRFAHTFGRCIFGVISSSEPMPNGILDLLRRYHKPVFDLDAPDNMADLERLLAPARERETLTRVGRLQFHEMLREFERLATIYPVSSHDLAYLTSQLEAILERARNGGSSGGS